MRLRSKKVKILLGVLVILALLAALVPWAVIRVSKAFTTQEQQVRTDWAFDTGEVVEAGDQWQVDIARADLGEGLPTFQLVPQDIEEEGFTYYDLEVQGRLDQALDHLKNLPEVSWSATRPLAVLNPFGTGSNGLYLYFETDMATSVSYTIHVEDPDIPDFTAQATEASGEEYTRTHELQLIGLVAGRTNQVTLTITGKWGNTRQVVSFSVDMPENRSGYDTQLEVTEGESQAQQSEGLFAMMRVNGHLGYGFFFDDAGVLRYELVLEGYGPDRILFEGDEMITCVSSSKLARIDGLGRVTGVWAVSYTHLGITGSRVGIVLTAMSAATVLFRPAAGYLLDNFNRYHVYLVFLALFCLSFPAFIAFPAFVPLIFVRLYMGVVYSCLLYTSLPRNSGSLTNWKPMQRNIP